MAKSPTSGSRSTSPTAAKETTSTNITFTDDDRKHYNIILTRFQNVFNENKDSFNPATFSKKATQTEVETLLNKASTPDNNDFSMALKSLNEKGLMNTVAGALSGLQTKEIVSLKLSPFIHFVGNSNISRSLETIIKEHAQKLKTQGELNNTLETLAKRVTTHAEQIATLNADLTTFNNSPAPKNKDTIIALQTRLADIEKETKDIKIQSDLIFTDKDTSDKFKKILKTSTHVNNFATTLAEPIAETKKSKKHKEPEPYNPQETPVALKTDLENMTEKLDTGNLNNLLEKIETNETKGRHFAEQVIKQAKAFDSFEQTIKDDSNPETLRKELKRLTEENISLKFKAKQSLDNPDSNASYQGALVVNDATKNFTSGKSNVNDNRIMTQAVTADLNNLNIARINERIGAIEKVQNETKKTGSDLAEQMRELQKKYETLNENINKADSNKKINGYTTELTELNNKKNELSKSYDAIKEPPGNYAITACDGKYNEDRSLNPKNPQTHLNELSNQTNESLNVRIDRLGKIYKYATELKTFNQNISETKPPLPNDVSTVTLENFQKKITELQTQVNEKTASISNFSTTVQDRTFLARELADTTSTGAYTNIDKDNLKKSVQDELNKQLNTLQELHNTEKEKLNAANAAAKNLATELRTLKAELVNFNADANTTQDQIDGLKQRITTTTDKINAEHNPLQTYKEAKSIFVETIKSKTDTPGKEKEFDSDDLTKDKSPTELHEAATKECNNLLEAIQRKTDLAVQEKARQEQEEATARAEADKKDADKQIVTANTAPITDRKATVDGAAGAFQKIVNDLPEILNQSAEPTKENIQQEQNRLDKIKILQVEVKEYLDNMDSQTHKAVDTHWGEFKKLQTEDGKNTFIARLSHGRVNVTADATNDDLTTAVNKDAKAILDDLKVKLEAQHQASTAKIKELTTAKEQQDTDIANGNTVAAAILQYKAETVDKIAQTLETKYEQIKPSPTTPTAPPPTGATKTSPEDDIKAKVDEISAEETRIKQITKLLDEVKIKSEEMNANTKTYINGNTEYTKLSDNGKVQLIDTLNNNKNNLGVTKGADIDGITEAVNKNEQAKLNDLKVKLEDALKSATENKKTLEKQKEILQQTKKESDATTVSTAIERLRKYKKENVDDKAEAIKTKVTTFLQGISATAPATPAASTTMSSKDLITAKEKEIFTEEQKIVRITELNNEITAQLKKMDDETPPKVEEICNPCANLDTDGKKEFEKQLKTALPDLKEPTTTDNISTAVNQNAKIELERLQITLKSALDIATNNESRLRQEKGNAETKVKEDENHGNIFATTTVEHARHIDELNTTYDPNKVDQLNTEAEVNIALDRLTELDKKTEEIMAEAERTLTTEDVIAGFKKGIEDNNGESLLPEVYKATNSDIIPKLRQDLATVKLRQRLTARITAIQTEKTEDTKTGIDAAKKILERRDQVNKKAEELEAKVKGLLTTSPPTSPPATKPSPITLEDQIKEAEEKITKLNALEKEVKAAQKEMRMKKRTDITRSTVREQCKACNSLRAEGKLSFVSELTKGLNYKFDATPTNEQLAAMAGNPNNPTFIKETSKAVNHDAQVKLKELKSTLATKLLEEKEYKKGLQTAQETKRENAEKAEKKATAERDQNFGALFAQKVIAHAEELEKFKENHGDLLIANLDTVAKVDASLDELNKLDARTKQITDKVESWPENKNIVKGFKNGITQADPDKKLLPEVAATGDDNTKDTVAPALKQDLESGIEGIRKQLNDRLATIKQENLLSSMNTFTEGEAAKDVEEDKDLFTEYRDSSSAPSLTALAAPPNPTAPTATPALGDAADPVAPSGDVAATIQAPVKPETIESLKQYVNNKHDLSSTLYEQDGKLKTQVDENVHKVFTAAATRAFIEELAKQEVHKKDPINENEKLEDYNNRIKNKVEETTIKKIRYYAEKGIPGREELHHEMKKAVFFGKDVKAESIFENGKEVGLTITRPAKEGKEGTEMSVSIKDNGVGKGTSLTAKANDDSIAMLIAVAKKIALDNNITDPALLISGPQNNTAKALDSAEKIQNAGMGVKFSTNMQDTILKAAKEAQDKVNNAKPEDQAKATEEAKPFIEARNKLIKLDPSASEREKTLAAEATKAAEDTKAAEATAATPPPKEGEQSPQEPPIDATQSTRTKTRLK